MIFINKSLTFLLSTVSEERLLLKSIYDSFEVNSNRAYYLGREKIISAAKYISQT